jgi:hypothetical protein
LLPEAARLTGYAEVMTGDGEKWPRGTGDAWKHADPGDPLSPQPPIRSDMEYRLRQHARRQLPHLASTDLRPVQFAEVFAKLAAVAMAKAEFYGQMLADMYDRYDQDGARSVRDEDASDSGLEYYPGDGKGIRALVGDVYSVSKDGDAIAIGEAIRALVKLEAEERDRAADLAYKGIRVGIEAKQVDVMRSYGRTVVAAMRALCLEMGIDWGSEETRLKARRAIITARTSLGDLVVPEQHEVTGG